jgi:putative Mg2+ transporter-C (MgtC) family protein
MDFLRAIGAGAAQINIIIAVIVAMGLGAVIGYDREGAHKPAGLRTHILVAGAAALFVGLGTLIVQIYQSNLGAMPMAETVRSDPIRVFEAIITGISFLGAGTIIRHRGGEQVEGITTAASLLMTAAIGATIGLRQWFLGIVLTALVYVVLRVLGKIKASRTHLSTHG